MTYNRYRIEKRNSSLVLINQQSNIDEYDVVWVEPETKTLRVSAINRIDRIRFSFDLVDDIDMELIKYCFPECFI